MSGYSIFFTILLILTVGCKRVSRVKKITGSKCTICETIFSPETTLVERPPWMDEKKRTAKGWVEIEFLFDYRDTICETCAKIIKKEGEEAYRKGLKNYKKGNYGEALSNFVEALDKGIKDAKAWEKKAKEKYAVEVERELAKIRAREKAYASESREKERQRERKIKAEALTARYEKTVDNVHFKIFPPSTPKHYEHSRKHIIELGCEITNFAKTQLKEFRIQAIVFSHNKSYSGEYKAKIVHPGQIVTGTIEVDFFGGRIDSIRIGKCKTKF